MFGFLLRLGHRGRYVAGQIMIECLPNTVIDKPDDCVIKRMASELDIQFDSIFLNALPQFHGGEPRNPYFFDAAGVQHRIAFFLQLVDDGSRLAPPLQESIDYFHNKTDARIVDRGIDYIIECDANGFFNGDRLVPFAALFTPDGRLGELLDPRDASKNLWLTPIDGVTCNALCFDNSTDPHSIVVFHAEQSCDERTRYWDDDIELEQIQYNRFTEFVTESFSQFTKMLSDS